MNEPRARGVVPALIGVQFAFASWSIVGKVTLGVVPPLALVAFRLVGCALLFGALNRHRGGRWLPPPGERLEALVLALTGLVANQIFFTEGLRLTSAIETAVLGSTIPIFTVTYGAASRREHASARVWWGVVIALLGVVLVARPQRLTLTDRHLQGNLLILLNSIAYSVYLVRGREFMARHGADAAITWLFFIAAVAIAPLGIPQIIASASHWDGRVWSAIVYVVLVPTAFSYGVNAWALARAPSSLVATFVYLQPALAIAMAIAFGDALASWLAVPQPHERLTSEVAFGMVGILAGVTLAVRRR